MTRGVRLPAALVAEWSDDPAWLAELPSLAAACAGRWGLVLEEPVETPRALVVPAGDVVLKLNAPSHVEAEHEADALELRGGRGSVRLLDRDDEHRALLLERCRPGTHLRGSGADEHAVLSGLLEMLAATPPASHPFRLLADEADRWADEIPARYACAGRPFESSLVDLAVDAFRRVDRAARSLVDQDLHGENVLRATREPWLALDPKPLVGEPELNGVAALRNALDVADARRWLDAFAGLGYDRERVRGLAVAHALAWGWDEREGWSARALAAARIVAAA